jgi:hypothetical protein
MMLRYLALATVVVLPALPVACDESANGCEDAKTSFEVQLKTLCGDPAYAGSPFCACCVANGFYSVADDCTCRVLSFDADACYFATDVEALPSLRSAVDYASSICQGRKAGVPYADAGTLGAQCTAGNGATTSSSSSSSSSSASSSSGTQANGGASASASSTSASSTSASSASASTTSSAGGGAAP